MEQLYEVITPCGHIYHDQCLSGWLDESRSIVNCPDCRSPLCADQIRRVYFNYTNDSNSFKLQLNALRQGISERDNELQQLRTDKLKTTESFLRLNKKCNELIKRLDKEGSKYRTSNKECKIQCRLSKQIDFVDSQLDLLLKDFKQMELEIDDIGQRLNSCENILSIGDSG